MLFPLILAVFVLKRICQFFCATFLIYDICISILSVFLMLYMFSSYLSVVLKRVLWLSQLSVGCVMMMMCEYYHVRKFIVCRLNGSCFEKEDCERRIWCNMSCRLWECTDKERWMELKPKESVRKSLHAFVSCFPGE